MSNFPALAAARVTLGAILLTTPLVAFAEKVETAAGRMIVSPIVSDLDTPWGFAVTPDGTILITERDGRLLAVKGDQRQAVSGLPEDIVADGQGGLLDITLPRDFAQSREVFLTYAKAQGRGAGTALYVARLSDDATRLEQGRTLWEMAPGSTGGRHFGSRVVEGADGTLFITVGERGDRPAAQDLSRHNGSVVRINRDGSIPADNPFVGQDGALPDIWSYGHRNPQGMALDASGQLWINEHGAQGGDEVNRITAGANYGWPVISYGRHYSGRSIGEGTAKPGMQQPEMYWDPSIAPSGMMFYDGVVADWQGDAFVGSLKFGYIARLSGGPLREVEQIRAAATGRVRDLHTGPDGALWYLSVLDGALFRLGPAE